MTESGRIKRCASFGIPILIAAICLVGATLGCGLNLEGDSDADSPPPHEPGPGEGTDPGPVLNDGSTGNPVFTLTWSHMENNEGPDIDMWVIDPNHVMLSTSRDGASLGPTAEGGAIDYDDQGETGPGDGGGAERAFWPAGRAPAGIYTYGVRYYAGTGLADYTLRVYKNGSLSANKSGSLSAPDQRHVLGAACNVPAFQDLCNLYNSNPRRFQYCQDLAYAEITGQVPPTPQTSKALIKDLLDQDGYTKVYEGVVPTTHDPNAGYMLEEGDVVMLYLTDPPNDPRNAPHYAVVRGGKLWQVLHWQEGGQLDGPRDLAFFGNARNLINAYTGQSKVAGNAFVYFVCYNR